jgi:hypothetical protein
MRTAQSEAPVAIALSYLVPVLAAASPPARIHEQVALMDDFQALARPEQVLVTVAGQTYPGQLLGRRGDQAFVKYRTGPGGFQPRWVRADQLQLKVETSGPG